VCELMFKNLSGHYSAGNKNNSCIAIASLFALCC
jgi:hypothetical protein